MAVASIAVAGSVLISCGSSGSSSGSSNTTSGSGGTTGTTAAALTGDPVVIGVQYDNAGPGAGYSTPAREAAGTCVDSVNAAGGVLGGRPLKVIDVNDSSNPTDAPAATRKLIQDGAVALLFVSGSGATAQSTPVANESKIPSIATFTPNDSLAAQPENPYIYTLNNPLPDWGATFAEGLKQAKVTKIGMIQESSPAIAAINKVIEPIMTDAGIEIVSKEVVAPDAKDVTAELTRIKGSRPEMIFVSTSGGQLEVLIHNTRETVMPDVDGIGLVGIGGQPSNLELVNPGALEGFVFLDQITETNDDTVELQSVLREAKGKDSYRLTYVDAMTCDGVFLLAEAIDSAGSTDADAVNAALRTVTGYVASWGYPGNTLSFSADDHTGVDNLCGMVPRVYDADNKPAEPWDKYTPDC